MKQRYIAALLAEGLGTFVLVLVVLSVSNYRLPFFTAIAAGVTVATFVSLFGKLSGGHFNPAVTISLFCIRQVSFIRLVGYWAVQFLGAFAALQLYNNLTQVALKNSTTPFDWRIMLAEALGTFIFIIGVSVAVTQKFDGWKQAATIGSALFLGITVAVLASRGICNPAVALGLRTLDGNYFLGPILGGVVAALLSAYVLYPIFGNKANATSNAPTAKAAPVKKAEVVKPASSKAPAKKAAAKPAAKKSPAKKTSKK